MCMRGACVCECVCGVCVCVCVCVWCAWWYLPLYKEKIRVVRK